MKERIKFIVGICILLLIGIIILGDAWALADNKETILLEKIYDKEYNCYDVINCNEENGSIMYFCGVSRKCDFIKHTGFIGNIIEEIK